MSPNQPAWQQAVMQIAADLMRMRWDERIPEDFAQALCDKGVRLRDVVYDARRNAEIVSGGSTWGAFLVGPPAFIADEPPQAGIRRVGGSTEFGRTISPPTCSAGAACSSTANGWVPLDSCHQLFPSAAPSPAAARAQTSSLPNLPAGVAHNPRIAAVGYAIPSLVDAGPFNSVQNLETAIGLARFYLSARRLIDRLP